MGTTDICAMVAVEGGPPMADCFEGWFEAYPPHGLTMEEWCDACASAQAYGPDVICFDFDGEDIE